MDAEDAAEDESPEALAKWTAEIGADADAAAIKMQSRARARQAKKEVEALRNKLAAAEQKEEVAEQVAEEDDPAALAEWAAGLGDKGDKAASLMQARHRGAAVLLLASLFLLEMFFIRINQHLLLPNPPPSCSATSL